MNFNKKLGKPMKSKKIVLGQFYTSDSVAEFMVGLTTKGKDAKILEPSFGTGVFIESLLKNGFSNIKGCEIDKDNYENVKNTLKANITIENGDYLKTQKAEKFDLIIGNPPYVHWNNIDITIRDLLSKDPFWKLYSNGEWDLLYPFIIWSIEKLNENGELIFIVPYNWFNSTYAESLRQYLIANGQFEVIVHFGEFKLFQDCYPNNIIFRYKKTKTAVKPLIFVAEFKGKTGFVAQILRYFKEELEKIDHKEYEKEDGEFKIFTMPQFESGNLWYLATPTEKKTISKIENMANDVKLSDYLDIGVGVVSGYDDAFIINNGELNKYTETEKQFIYPFLKAKDCKRYLINGLSHYLLIDEVKSETELKKYPNIYNRLLSNKEGLENRYITNGKLWWHWATIRNYDLFKRNLNKPKIFVPCIDRSLLARFSYTEKACFGSGDVLIIANKNGLKEDMKYILAWLNSDYINTWYHIKGSHSGHRIKYTQSYVSRIPLRLIDWNNKDEVGIYKKIVKEVENILVNKNDAGENKVNSLFNELLGDIPSDI